MILKRKGETETDGLTGVGQALDEISWQWLSDNFPRLAEAIQNAVDGGTMPDGVRRFVMARTQRYELALRCEQAARYLLQGVG
jgi:hypothetical protein